jgi:site-specific recombinase XerD
VVRRLRNSKLESRSARLALPVRTKPYVAVKIARGITLRYRRNKAAGSWDVKVYDGRGKSWTRRIGAADDIEAADNRFVFDFFQAQALARKIARGTPEQDSTKPLTVRAAVDRYAADLVRRGGDVANAGRIRKHVTKTLAGKIVALITEDDLTAWHNGLVGTLKPASLRRLFQATKAALNAAARSDRTIRNASVWKHALSGIKNTFGTRNKQVLSDADIHRVIAAAYEEGPEFGRLVEVLAETGTRISQAARLTVSDLKDGANPRLVMPVSRKGRGERKISHQPVPITAALAAKLKLATKGKAKSALLLPKPDGTVWVKDNHARPFARTIERAGLPAETSSYSLRHSFVVRAALHGVPLRVIAALVDSSVGELERTYTAYLPDHADGIARAALLAPPPPAADVIPVSGAR